MVKGSPCIYWSIHHPWCIWWRHVESWFVLNVGCDFTYTTKVILIVNVGCCNPNLGLATKARACKVVGQEESPGIKPHALESARKCWGIDPHTPKGIPTLGVGVPVDFWMFKEQLQGSNPNGLKIFYIIRKILKLKCLKWTRMTHLDIWNISYGQKKGQESNWQFDSWPLEIKNQLDLLTCRWRATYHSKALDEGYNFASNLISIWDLHMKLWAPQSHGSLGTKCHLNVAFMERHKILYIKVTMFVYLSVQVLKPISQK
jgi:hypothetical protein